MFKALTRNAAAVGDLSELLDVSPRQLLRRCVAAVGYGPKALRRILRFQRLLVAAGTRVAHPVAALAIELGYADQAHLTDESTPRTGSLPLHSSLRSGSPATHPTITGRRLLRGLVGGGGQARPARRIDDRVEQHGPRSRGALGPNRGSAVWRLRKP